MGQTILVPSWAIEAIIQSMDKQRQKHKRNIVAQIKNN